MPFSNSYNKGVAGKVITNAKRDIAIKQQMYDNPAAFVEPRSTQECMSVQQPEIQGGSGNLAASSYDMGEETKKVGGSRINKARATRVAKALEGGAKPMVITDTVAVKPKRVRKAKTTAPVGSGAVGGDFNDVMDAVKKTASTVGDVVKTAATVAPYVLPLVGLGKEGKPKRTMAHLSEWNSLVKKVRTETGKSLKDALKHIKENNLYKKKGATDNVKQPTVKRPRKTKEGGSSGGILIDEVAKARTKGDVVAMPRETKGVPSMKVPRTRAKRIPPIQ
jgi:hypothetical protein